MVEYHISMLRKAVLLFHTLRYLKPSQYYFRLRRLQRDHLLASDEYPLPPTGEYPPSIDLTLPFEAETVPREADDIMDGQFSFIGRSTEFVDEIRWRDAPEDDLLWSFNLHYFDWGVLLAKAWRATNQPEYACRVLELIEHWIDNNPFSTGPGWHPYPTSRRLFNWVVIAGAVSDYAGFVDICPKFLASLDQQASYLADWPEKDLEANHLLANYFALAWVEMHLGDYLRSETRKVLGGFQSKFWREFLIQTKSDGSHEENSASYQMAVLQDALLLLATGKDRPVSDDARERLEQMFEWLISVLLPVGNSKRVVDRGSPTELGNFRIPLVNDSVRSYPTHPLQLLALGAAYFARPDWKFPAAKRGNREAIRWWLGKDGVNTFESLSAYPPKETSRIHRDSGYAVIRSSWSEDSDYVLFDCGSLGPDHLLAHAHADTLNVIICASGIPIVVDPGVFSYSAYVWRDHFRSTRAHNTVTVDGEDQSEVWSAFRVGRRARAHLDEWVAGRRVAGHHDGYRRLKGDVTHRRAVEYRGDSRWRIEDRLVARSGRHRYELTFQLSPIAREVSIRDSRATVHFEGGMTVRFDFRGPEELIVDEETGWVSETWNQKVPAPRLVGHLDTEAGEVELITEIEAVERS